MREKIERSVEHADVALEAYRARPGVDPDDVAAIGDLIADLLHLAAVRMAAVEAEHGCEVAWDGAISPAGLAERAVEHFEYEANPKNADEEV